MRAMHRAPHVEAPRAPCEAPDPRLAAPTATATACRPTGGATGCNAPHTCTPVATRGPTDSPERASAEHAPNMSWSHRGGSGAPETSAITAVSTGAISATAGGAAHASMGSGTDAHMHDPPQDNTSDAHASEVQQKVLEASQKLSKLLGVEGEETRRRADALEAVVDVHRSDGQMYHEFVSLVSMPSWLLTEVRMRFLSAPQAIGCCLFHLK